MLDWQLFLSTENFWAAWDKVRRNHGCAGVDGETIASFERHADRNLSTLRRQLQLGTYQPLPLRSFQVPKQPRLEPGAPAKTEWRMLSVPTVRDRIVQQALLNLLHPILEPQFEECSFAYRPGRSYKSAVQQVETWRERGYDWVLDADVVKYFDNIQHPRLLAELQERVHDPAIGTLVEQWMSSGVSTATGLILPSQGVPQGAVISPILANVYFDDFDEAIETAGFKLVRYADDFVILAKSKSRIEQAQTFVNQLLETMGLELHPDKTRIANFQQGFHFLGHTFVRSLIIQDQGKGKRRSKPRQAKQEEAPTLYHSDLPTQTTQMQQALLAAIRESEQPIPPPLYVVMGYRVRQTEKRVEITSQEFEWRNGMSTLYLVKQGMALRQEQGRFWVQAGSEGKTERAVEVPIREVERILVFGNIQLSTAVIGVCLEHQIPVVFLSQLGEYKGHLWSSEFCDLPVEEAQFERRREGAFQLQVARSIVRAKLVNSRQVLLRLNRKRQMPEVVGAIEKLLGDIAALELVDQLDLRGYEGMGAARYFPALGRLLTHEGFSFGCIPVMQVCPPFGKRATSPSPFSRSGRRGAGFKVPLPFWATVYTQVDWRGFSPWRSPLTPLFKGGTGLLVPLFKGRTGLLVPLFKGDLGGSEGLVTPLDTCVYTVARSGRGIIACAASKKRVRAAKVGCTLSFCERNRRPPRDPVNSLLSFGYTLLFNNVMSLILAEGLNPYLGNLHRSARKDPHLAFDLMEEWRSTLVDGLVIPLLNRKALSPTDFSWPNAEGGVYLMEPARRVFLKAFEERMGELTSHPDVQAQVSYQRAIQLQVQRYKQAVKAGTGYEPFVRQG